MLGAGAMPTRSIALLIGSLLVSGCAASPPSTASSAGASTASAPQARRAPGPVYRLDFVVSGADAGKPAGNGAYSINLEEDQSGEIRVGANVPLTPNGSSRQDVGLKLHVTYRLVGADLLLRDNVELSAIEEPAQIRRISSSGDAWVSPGKPTLVASAEDAATHRHYEVMVTATRLR